MRRRDLFESESDNSDLDIGHGDSRFSRRTQPTTGSKPRNVRDPLTSSFSGGGSGSSSFAAPASAAVPSTTAGVAGGLPVPESSKVTTTRHNLSQLFGGGSSLAPTTSTDMTARSSVDAAIHSTFGPSFSSAAPSSSSPPAPPFANPQQRGDKSLFTPSFTYESGGGSSVTSSSAAALASTAAMSSGGGGGAAAVEGLITALHAVVQVYRDALPCGTCMLALCVPPSTPASATTPSAKGVHGASSASLPPSAAVRQHLQQQQQQQPSSADAAPLSSAPGPTLLLISKNRQVLCRVALDAADGVFGDAGGAALQLRQNHEQPQYLAFFSSPSTTAAPQTAPPCWWTCMFPDRAQASEFLVATYTVAQFAAALAKRAGTSAAGVPTVRRLPSPPSAGSSSATKQRRSAAKRGGGGEDREGDVATEMVQCGVPTTLCWETWALRRVSRTTPYCVPRDCVDAVLPSAPVDVVPGTGALPDAVEAALVGMRSGESRLVFLTADETRARHPSALSRSPPSGTKHKSKEDEELHRDRHAGPAVAYVTCIAAVSATAAAAGAHAPPPPQALPLLPPARPQETAAGPAVTAADAAPTTNTLLQQLLVQTLQQQALSQPSQPSGLDTVERSLDRVMVQLGSLYEKIDRLDIDGKLQRNNAELERAMKRVVGLAPQEEVAIEDTLKDREALLASIERYRQKYEEANTNYQRALEAMGRSADRAQALEKDLHLQQELWTRQRHEETEQTRLRLLERDVRHREEMERVSEERYAAGKTEGHAAGYREGRQAALLSVEGATGGGGSAVVAEWKAKLMARDQQIVALQTALQDTKFRHEKDRRQLRAEIDVLADLNEKLQHLQANADVRMPQESAQLQGKRIKRTLNAVYTRVEAEVLQLPQQQRIARGPSDRRSGDSEQAVNGDAHGGDTDNPDNNSSGFTPSTGCVAIDDVLAVVMTTIKSEAQAALQQLREEAERRTRENADLRVLTMDRLHNPPQRSALPLPPPPPQLPPVHTAASQDALAAVAASLLPEVARAVTSTAAATDAQEESVEATGADAAQIRAARSANSDAGLVEPYRVADREQNSEALSSASPNNEADPARVDDSAPPAPSAANASDFSAFADPLPSVAGALPSNKTGTIGAFTPDCEPTEAADSHSPHLPPREDGQGSGAESLHWGNPGGAGDIDSSEGGGQQKRAGEQARATTAALHGSAVLHGSEDAIWEEETAASTVLMSPEARRADGGSSAVAAGSDQEAGLVPSPLSSASPLSDSASPASTTKPSRQATRLPELQGAFSPPYITAGEGADSVGPPALTGGDAGGVDGGVRRAAKAPVPDVPRFSDPPLFDSEAIRGTVQPAVSGDQSLDAGHARGVSAATTWGRTPVADGSTPPLQAWEGRRLFATPPSTVEKRQRQY